MTPLGWLVMLLSIASVIALTAFCLYRVLTLPPPEIDELSYPLEVDPTRTTPK
jgi:hypothetical protein